MNAELITQKATETEPIPSHVDTAAQPAARTSREKRRRRKLDWLQRSLSPTEFKFPKVVLRHLEQRRTPSPTKKPAKATVKKTKAFSMDFSPLTNELARAAARPTVSAYSSFEFPEVRPTHISHVRYPRVQPLFSDLKQRFSHFHRPLPKPGGAVKPGLQLLPLRDVQAHDPFLLVSDSLDGGRSYHAC